MDMNTILRTYGFLYRIGAEVILAPEVKVTKPSKNYLRRGRKIAAKN